MPQGDFHAGSPGFCAFHRVFQSREEHRFLFRQLHHIAKSHSLAPQRLGILETFPQSGAQVGVKGFDHLFAGHFKQRIEHRRHGRILGKSDTAEQIDPALGNGIEGDIFYGQQTVCSRTAVEGKIPLALFVERDEGEGGGG